MTAAEHRKHTPGPGEIRVAVITVSDTRTPETDVGGRTARELCAAAGLAVADPAIVPDDAQAIATALRARVAGGADVVLLTGGTGVARRDVTVEAVSPLLDKPLPGFGELFRALSFAEIGPAAMLSRACAGTLGATAVFLLPGSPAGVRLALERLILPELPHLVGLVRGERRHEHHR